VVSGKGEPLAVVGAAFAQAAATLGLFASVLIIAALYLLSGVLGRRALGPAVDAATGSG
jgi:hypothetical protein